MKKIVNYFKVLTLIVISGRSFALVSVSARLECTKRFAHAGKLALS